MNRIQENFDMLNSRLTHNNFNPMDHKPVSIPECFKVQDIRILSDRSVFEEYDALRKSYQFDKDFINDQDSVCGFSIVNHMIKNILCTQLGSIKSDPTFGVDLTYHLFEQLDWVGVIAIRDHIASQLDVNLPVGVEVEEVDILANPDGEANSIEISIIYSINDGKQSVHRSDEGPGKSLNSQVVRFTLGVEGFTNFSSPNATQFRRAK